MIRVPDAAEDRVRRLIQAARRVADPSDPLGKLARDTLPQATGLSPAGVELALSRSLEIAPSDEEISSLCASVPTAPRAHVLLSANVFVAAHRAIALALASSHQVEVRTSRREPQMAALLQQAAGGLFRIVDELAPLPGEHIWAYGHDETLEALRGDLPSGVILHPHGSGLGVALFASPTECVEPTTIQQAARRLATDIVLFDQRGCLSPRLVLVEGSPETSRTLAQALAVELGDYEQRVPRGDLSSDELADLVRYRDTLLYAAELFPAGRGCVGLDVSIGRLYLPPVGRSLQVMRVDTVEPMLESLVSSISAIGVEGPIELRDRASRLVPQARISDWGQMQSPKFDGPVDRRPPPKGEAL